MPVFGDALADRFHVPIGLVPIGIGATRVRVWLPAGVRFSRLPSLTRKVVWRRYHYVSDPGEANGWPRIMDDWLRRHREMEASSGADPNSLGIRDRTLSALDLSGQFARQCRANLFGRLGKAELPEPPSTDIEIYYSRVGVVIEQAEELLHGKPLPKTITVILVFDVRFGPRDADHSS